MEIISGFMMMASFSGERSAGSVAIIKGDAQRLQNENSVRELVKFIGGQSAPKGMKSVSRKSGSIQAKGRLYFEGCRSPMKSITCFTP
jgi:hypothetical protein